MLLAAQPCPEPRLSEQADCALIGAMAAERCLTEYGSYGLPQGSCSLWSQTTETECKAYCSNCSKIADNLLTQCKVTVGGATQKFADYLQLVRQCEETSRSFGTIDCAYTSTSTTMSSTSTLHTSTESTTSSRTSTQTTLTATTSTLTTTSTNYQCFASKDLYERNCYRRNACFYTPSLDTCGIMLTALTCCPQGIPPEAGGSREVARFTTCDTLIREVQRDCGDPAYRIYLGAHQEANRELCRGDYEYCWWDQRRIMHGTPPPTLAASSSTSTTSISSSPGSTTTSSTGGQLRSSPRIRFSWSSEATSLHEKLVSHAALWALASVLTCW